MSRTRHPSKDIEDAIQYAEANNWRVSMARGHAWGRIYCEFSDRDGCIASIWSTPKNPQNEAKRIRKIVDKCSHKVED